MSMVDPKRQTQGDRDADKLRRAYNPPKSKKNTTDDKRNIIQKVIDEGTSAGGKIPAGGVGGKSAGDNPGKNPASGCPNPGDGDVLGAIWKPLCELGHGVQAGTENSLPMIAIAVGAVIVLVMVIK